MKHDERRVHHHRGFFPFKFRNSSDIVAFDLLTPELPTISDPFLSRRSKWQVSEEIRNSNSL